MISLSRASALPLHWPLNARHKGPGIQVPWAHLAQPSPGAEPDHFAGAPPPFARRLCGAARQPWASRARAGQRRQICRSCHRWVFPAKSQPRLLTPKSPGAPSPGPRPRPLLCILPMSERPDSGWGGSLPFPNDTISLIGLAFCYVPTPVRHEPSLNVKGSGAGGEPEPPWKALVSSTLEKGAAQEENGWRY